MEQDSLLDQVRGLRSPVQTADSSTKAKVHCDETEGNLDEVLEVLRKAVSRT
jgi:hypothetical protein